MFDRELHLLDLHDRDTFHILRLVITFRAWFFDNCVNIWLQSKIEVRVSSRVVLMDHWLPKLAIQIFQIQISSDLIHYLGFLEVAKPNLRLNLLIIYLRSLLILILLIGLQYFLN